MRPWLANTTPIENRPGDPPQPPVKAPTTPSLGQKQFPQYLWIDGVGGYRLLANEEVIIGQATPNDSAHLMILGDLSRRALAIRRSGTDYLIQPWQDIRLSGTTIDRPTMLSDASEIFIGPRIVLNFKKPNPWSCSAILQMASHHRWQPFVDGAILFADSCVLGPQAGSHIVCPFWKQELILFRDGQKLFCRSHQPLLVNQEFRKGEFELVSGDRVRDMDLSFGIE